MKTTRGKRLRRPTPHGTVNGGNRLEGGRFPRLMSKYPPVSRYFRRAESDVPLSKDQPPCPPFPRPLHASKVYMATVPPGVPPGGEFNVMVNSHPVRVTCPANVTPGMQIRIRLEEPQGALHQTFEVAVPQGVRPGQPFALIGGFRRCRFWRVKAWGSEEHDRKINGL